MGVITRSVQQVGEDASEIGETVVRDRRVSASNLTHADQEDPGSQ
jgi:hypothetical protein